MAGDDELRNEGSGSQTSLTALRDKKARPSAKAPARGEKKRRNSGGEATLQVPVNVPPGARAAADESGEDDIQLMGLTRRASLHTRSSAEPANPTVFATGPESNDGSSSAGGQTGRSQPAAPSPTSAKPAPTAPPSANPRNRRESLMRHADAAQNTNVRVMVRVRPFSEKEIKKVGEEGGYMQSVIDMPRRDQVLLLDHKNEYNVAQGFNFDEVFWSCTQQKSNVKFSDQRRVYEMTGLPALQGAWDGINSCIFAYGQTGSGKTHTMMGDPEQIANPEGCAETLLGLIPRLCRDLFEELARKEKNALQAGLRRKSDVRVRFYEIYNEKVKDLLCSVEGEQERFKYAGTTQKKLDPDDLKIREHPTEGPYVEGISIHNPRSYDDIIRLINAGNQERSVGSTNLNERSSRSHAIFRITVTQTTFYDQQRVGIGGPKTTTHQRRANINLVDLAGSENVKRSGARGSLLIEAQKINLSLTTLRRVIDALIEKKAKVTVPYRDSTLTWLLREDLGGNAKTFMLATVSPHYDNAHESLRTLEYAMRARSIVNSVRVNEDETAKMLADLEKKMLDAQKQMSAARTEAEVQELEQRVEEAKKASKEIEDRLEEASAEVTEYKEKLEAEKEKNMAFAFRHAVMLRAAKLRLSTAESKNEGQSAELQAIKSEMAKTGHDNIGDLTVSLVRERGKVTDLERENYEISRKKRELEEKHEELVRMLRQEEEEGVRRAQLSAEQEGEARRQQEEHERQMNQQRQTFTKQIDELMAKHAEQMKKQQAINDRELSAIIDENQSIVEEFQNKVQELELRLGTEAEEHTKALRTVEQDREQQQRYLHADIARREELIDKLDAELTEALREQKSTKEDYERLVRKHAALEAEIDQRIARRLAEAEARHEAKEAELGATIKGLEEEVAAKVREKAEVQNFFRDVGTREEKYSASFDLVCQFLGQLESGEVPDDWTMEDMRRVVAVFAQFKREYVSHRPNRDLLRTMLRVNPQRRGAEHMKKLIEGGAAEKGEGMQVLLGAMPCPAIATGKESVPRLESTAPEEGEAEARKSAAEGLPYPLEGTSHTAIKAAADASRRRSRTTPRVSGGEPAFPSEQGSPQTSNPSGSAHRKRKSHCSSSKLAVTKPKANGRNSIAKPPRV